MTLPEGLTLRAVTARAVSAPMERPLQTASGEITSAPLVLIDLSTREGVTGRSYLCAYTPLALEPLTRLVAGLGDVLAGEPVAPVELQRTLASRFRLLGSKGLPTMAMAGIDMAAWDALAKAVNAPVVRLLGGQPKPIPAYGSLKAMRPADAAAEAQDLARYGFDAYKGRIGYADVNSDRDVVHAIRDAVGSDSRIAVDYNQSLSVPEATRRLAIMADEDLLWSEEPTRADDFSGHARIRQSVSSPIQLGENWWGTGEMAASLAAGASDLAMVDVMRIGGVTGWLHAAGLAEGAGIPLSSHLFPEVSAHLLAISPTADRLEFLDLASPVLQRPARAADGYVHVPTAAGFDLEWDEEAVNRYATS